MKLNRAGEVLGTENGLTFADRGARPSRAPRTVSSGRGDAWSTRALPEALESPSSGREGLATGVLRRIAFLKTTPARFEIRLEYPGSTRRETFFRVREPISR
jgi:hypothetical protein